MKRAVEECPHRIIRAPAAGTDEVVHCSVARQILGSSPDHLSRVDASVCRACCEHHLPSPGHLNPVVASVVFLAAAQSAPTALPPGAKTRRLPVARRG